MRELTRTKGNMKKAKREKTLTAREKKLNAMFEKLARVLKKEHGFEEEKVLGSMRYFPKRFFENSIPLKGEYFRDSDTHAALMFNPKTEEVTFIDAENFWTEAELAFYRSKKW